MRDETRDALCLRIDAALERMQQQGYQTSVHYARLCAKRDALVLGASCTVSDVLPLLIGGVGAMIATKNTSTKGQRLLSHGMQQVRDTLAWSVEESRVYYPDTRENGPLVFDASFLPDECYQVSLFDEKAVL